MMMRDTVDFDKPLVSPITCRKLPEAKTATQQELVQLLTRHGFERWPFEGRHEEGRPKVQLTLGQNDIDFSTRRLCIRLKKKSSRSLDFLSFLLTGPGIKPKPPNSKSAIFSIWGKFPWISKLIHLARCVKFNP